MKSIKSHIINFLFKRGYTLNKTEIIERISLFFFRVLNEERNKKTDNTVGCIVFSKDRVMQLHAFINSYFNMVNNPGILYVLYTYSSIEHSNSYSELKSLFCNQKVVFVEETKFRDDLIEIVNCIGSKTIGLFVDDMVFVNKIDFDMIKQVDTRRYILTLSRGKDLNYCVPLSKKMVLPTFYQSAYGFNSFYWDEFNELNDWTFPLGLSGYFYGNSELKIMLEYISFKSPNSLELALGCYHSLFVKRIGLCPDNILCPCVHANIVQSDHINPTIGTHSVDELLEKWVDGYKIDLSKLYFRKGSDVQFSNYDFILRSII